MHSASLLHLAPDGARTGPPRDLAVERPHLPGRTGLHQRGALTIALAVVLAAIIFVLRELLPNPNEGLTNLYAIPIAIVAVRFGALGGAVSAALSLALFAQWEIANPDVVVGPVGYVSRGAAFLVLGLIVGRFASERRVLIARLGELASTDPLTGVANRASFEAELGQALARARRHGRPGALLLADLDGFKAVNDTLGHAAGDRVLREVADVLREQVRATDVIARIGGDEFVVLLPEIAPEEAERIARRISVAVPRSVREDGGASIMLGASVGCVYFEAGTPDSPEQLLHAADEAMYRIKDSRRA